MSQGFYELVGADPGATASEIQAAYQRRLGELVRRLKAARRQGADVTVLEAQERTLREAVGILKDPARRRRYDAFTKATSEGLPTGAEDLWERARDGFVDPAGAVAVDLLTRITDLPLGSPAHELEAVESESTEPEPTRPMVTLVPAAPMVELPSDPAVRYSVPEAMLPEPMLDPPTQPSLDLGGPGPSDRDEGWFDTGEQTWGPTLKGIRESKGLSLEDLAESTRISLQYIEAIEVEAYDRLPATTFVRGYLKELARVLEVDEQQVVDGYLRGLNNGRG